VLENGLPVQPVRLLQPSESVTPSLHKPAAIEAKKKRKLDDLTPRIDAFLAKATNIHKRPKSTENTDKISISPPPKGLLAKAASTEVAFSLSKCREAVLERRPERRTAKEGAILGKLDETNLVGKFLCWLVNDTEFLCTFFRH
jgi:hypothetical protein